MPHVICPDSYWRLLGRCRISEAVERRRPGISNQDAMLYEAKLSSTELELLANLIGQTLRCLRADGWSSQLYTPHLILSIEPEEIATPDKTHQYADVERPSVEIVEKSRIYERSPTLKEGCGLIHEIWIVSTLISFSPVVRHPSEEILPGVLLPESIGYGRVHHHPSCKDALIAGMGNDNAIVDLDIAIELVTEIYPSILFYTRGYFVEVSLVGLPQDESWVQAQKYTRHLLVPNSAF